MTVQHSSDAIRSFAVKELLNGNTELAAWYFGWLDGQSSAQNQAPPEVARTTPEYRAYAAAYQVGRERGAPQYDVDRAQNGPFWYTH